MNTVNTSTTSPAKWERRSDYRLHYPAELQPVLRIATCNTPVLDISESGIRFVVPEKLNAAQGAHLEGVVGFHDGVRQRIVGSVVRVEENEMAACLEKGFDFQLIFREHDWVAEQSDAQPERQIDLFSPADGL